MTRKQYTNIGEEVKELLGQDGDLLRPVVQSVAQSPEVVLPMPWRPRPRVLRRTSFGSQRTRAAKAQARTRMRKALSSSEAATSHS